MFTFKLIPGLVALLAIIDTSLAAPLSNITSREMSNGCYMILTPNPTTDMLKKLQSYFAKGTYKIEIKFGDGAEAPTPRDKAYSTANPNFKYGLSTRLRRFSYSMDGSMKSCGKKIESHILEVPALSNQSPKVVVKNGGTEWYTLLLGTKIDSARAAYDILNAEMADFGKQKFTDTKEATDWADKFFAKIKDHLTVA
ncbi:hypothetical protein BDP27DRAFT_1370551 [Rhodocollybia butyracea]|uniref:Uncharacterized protein n=1 Tax=Rhodocollybia butyracea TaxID=206335 RepID=A0A9P5PCX9_9AGAR|nr:hypothetical protein BDP27DRAFT_1370551 [Rhodocollybia butyracea]